MKKLTKIFSLVLALAMLFSLSAMAKTIEGDEVLKFTTTASTDTIKAGDEFTVSVYLSIDGSDETIDLEAGLGLSYDLIYDSSALTLLSAAHGYGVASTDMVNAAGSYGYFVDSADLAASISADTALSVYTFKAAEALTEANYAIAVSDEGQMGYWFADQSTWTEVYDFIGDSVTVTVGADEPIEEEFGIASTGSALAGTDTMKDENGENVAAAGDKVVAIFSKNVSDAELAAGSYGIIFGGVRYAGQAAVPAKTAWAIKLVGSAEQLPAGNYSYGVFAGDEVVNADSAWVIE